MSKANFYSLLPLVNGYPGERIVVAYDVAFIDTVEYHRTHSWCNLREEVPIEASVLTLNDLAGLVETETVSCNLKDDVMIGVSPAPLQHDLVRSASRPTTTICFKWQKGALYLCVKAEWEGRMDRSAWLCWNNLKTAFYVATSRFAKKGLCE